MGLNTVVCLSELSSCVTSRKRKRQAVDSLPVSCVAECSAMQQILATILAAHGSMLGNMKHDGKQRGKPQDREQNSTGTVLVLLVPVWRKIWPLTMALAAC